jgi:hemolysin activation/secretion protein
MAFYKRYLDTEISLKTIFDIAAALTRAYGEKGFALSRAYVPAQEIDEDGIVKIVVVEGYISRVEFTGDTGSLSPRNKRRLEKLKIRKPISTGFLEKQILLVNETPGIKVVTSINRSERGGGALILKVDIDSTKYDFNAGINNRGSKAQGRERYNLGGTAKHVFGFDDLLSVSVRQTFDSNELQYYSLGYSRLIHDTGTRLDFALSYSTGEPGVDILELLEYETENMVFRADFTQPLWRSRRLNASLFYSFEINNSESDMLGAKNSEQDVRVLRAGCDFDVLDRFRGQTIARIMISRGMDIFGATDSGDIYSSRAQADYTFTALRTYIYHLQALQHGFSYFARISGQYSFDPLPYSEQHNYGGGFFGRAYDSSEISGDHSLMAGVELRYKVSRRPDWIDSLEPFMFASTGRAWIRGGSEDSASDAGLGIRLKALNDHYISLEWAKPLNHSVSLEGDKGGRFFMDWNYRF